MAESPTNASPPTRKKKNRRSKSSIAKPKKRKEAPKGSWSEVSTIKAGGSHVKSRWKRQYTGPRVLSEDYLAGDGQGWMPTSHANVAEEVENRRIRESNMEDQDTAGD